MYVYIYIIIYTYNIYIDICIYKYILYILYIQYMYIYIYHTTYTVVPTYICRTASLFWILRSDRSCVDAVQHRKHCVAWWLLDVIRFLKTAALWTFPTVTTDRFWLYWSYRTYIVAINCLYKFGWFSTLSGCFFFFFLTVAYLTNS